MHILPLQRRLNPPAEAQEVNWLVYVAPFHGFLWFLRSLTSAFLVLFFFFVMFENIFLLLFFFLFFCSFSFCSFSFVLFFSPFFKRTRKIRTVALMIHAEARVQLHPMHLSSKRRWLNSSLHRSRLLCLWHYISISAYLLLILKEVLWNYLLFLNQSVVETSLPCCSDTDLLSLVLLGYFKGGKKIWVAMRNKWNGNCAQLTVQLCWWGCPTVLCLQGAGLCITRKKHWALNSHTC